MRSGDYEQRTATSTPENEEFLETKDRIIKGVFLEAGSSCLFLLQKIRLLINLV